MKVGTETIARILERRRKLLYSKHKQGNSNNDQNTSAIKAAERVQDEQTDADTKNGS